MQRGCRWSILFLLLLYGMFRTLRLPGLPMLEQNKSVSLNCRLLLTGLCCDSMLLCNLNSLIPWFCFQDIQGRLMPYHIHRRCRQGAAREVSVPVERCHDSRRSLPCYTLLSAHASGGFPCPEPRMAGCAVGCISSPDWCDSRIARAVIMTERCRAGTVSVAG